MTPIVSTGARQTGWPYLDAPGPLMALAHRGGAEHPDLIGHENTLAAFEHAVALGYTHLETDVHVTSDGHLVAFHDDHLDRVTDRTGAIAELTLAEVQEARVAGVYPVPTLEELLIRLPEARFNIDLKAPGTEAPLLAVVERLHAWDRVLVGSFSLHRITLLRRLAAGRIPTSAHPWEAVLFRFLPSGRLAKWVATRLWAPGPVALQVPARTRWIRVVTRGFVRRAHAAGLQVHVWTIDDPAQMRQLLDLGVDGLVTDRTDVLKAVLAERGQWQGNDSDSSRNTDSKDAT